MAKNFYDILGVPKSASADDVKRAYRKLAGESHPDRGGSADKFKEINEAYQVLSDSAKRAQYDRYVQTFDQAQRGGGAGAGAGNPFGGAGGFDFSQGFAGGNPFGAGGVEFDLGDMFSDIFGGGRTSSSGNVDRRTRGVDLEMPITVTFEQAAFGVDQEITLEKKNTCATCSGTGAEPGSKVVTCPKCHGTGQIRTQRRTVLGTMSTASVCDQCEGAGKVPEKPCHTCRGSGVLRGEKHITVKIPAGINDGQRIRLTGEGEAGYRGSQPGDLYVLIHVVPSHHFRRENFDLYADLSVLFTQVALGATVDVPTLDGTEKLKIPAGTQPGKVFRLSGRGVQRLGHSGRGDLFVTVVVTVPEKLSKRQKELLKELQDGE
jgi:molecular chaperone DnaJ